MASLFDFGGDAAATMATADASMTGAPAANAAPAPGARPPAASRGFSMPMPNMGRRPQFPELNYG